MIPERPEPLRFDPEDYDDTILPWLHYYTFHLMLWIIVMMTACLVAGMFLHGWLYVFIPGLTGAIAVTRIIGAVNSLWHDPRTRQTGLSD